MLADSTQERFCRIDITRYGFAQRSEVDTPAAELFVFRHDEASGSSTTFTDGDCDVFLFTSFGRYVHFHESDISTSKRARGRWAIRLIGDEKVLTLLINKTEKTHVFTISVNGYGKKTAVTEYPVQPFGATPKIALQMSQRNGQLAAVAFVSEKDSLVVSTDDPTKQKVQIDGGHIIPMGRATQGIWLVPVACDDDYKVIGVDVVEDSSNRATNNHAH